MEVTHTDIAIVKLHEGVQFINETFENTIVGGPPVRLQEFAQASEIHIGSELYMDNPFTGYAEGTCGPHSISRIPTDDPHKPEQLWIRTRWDYLGQGSSKQLEDGICGSAIWNGNNKVIGFFRYAPKSGQCVDLRFSVSAEHMMEKGFSIVDTRNC
ncbi:hypothetical protein VTN96DRAFT_1016 [Rasamsonia emersonii]